MSLEIQTLSGKITHLGHKTGDAKLSMFSRMELSTASDLVELTDIVLTDSLDRGFALGTNVTISFTKGPGKNAKTLIWAVRDDAAGRVFSEKQLFGFRGQAVLQTVASTFPMLFLMVVGLCFFVIPGLVVGWLIFKMYRDALSWPKPDAIEAAVNALKVDVPTASPTAHPVLRAA